MFGVTCRPAGNMAFYNEQKHKYQLNNAVYTQQNFNWWLVGWGLTAGGKYSSNVMYIVINLLKLELQILTINLTINR